MILGLSEKRKTHILSTKDTTDTKEKTQNLELFPLCVLRVLRVQIFPSETGEPENLC